MAVQGIASYVSGSSGNTGRALKRMSDINDEAMKQALILVHIFIISISISFGIGSLY